MSPKQLLGASELQYHVCDPVKDSWEHDEVGAQPANTRSPHRDSKTVEHLDGSHGPSSNPSTDSHYSRQQKRDKLMKTGLQYLRSVAARPSNDQSNQAGIGKHPQTVYSQYQHRQSEWQQTRDHGQQAIQGSVHRQHFYEMVSISFIFASYLNCYTANQATGYASQHIWCLSQARINWEGWGRKGIWRKNGG